MDNSYLGQMTIDMQGNLKSSTGSFENRDIGPIVENLMAAVSDLLKSDEMFTRITVSYVEEEYQIYYDCIQLCILHKKKD